jgi:hypothetical protein
MMFGELTHWSHQKPLSPHFRDLLYRQTWGMSNVSDPVPKSDFLVGLSVGQGAQPSGVAVLERLPPTRPRASRSYACRYLRRWLPPDTAYPTLVSHLTEMFRDPPLNRNDLIVEAGPGTKAAVAFVRKNRLQARIQPVEVRASAEDTYVEGFWRVAKATMIETTRQVLQEDRFVFDDQMPPEVMATTPSAQTIYQALLTYPFNKTPALNEAFASREGADDDLILAVALACWFGERCRFEFWMR